ncbi:MAG: Holliday junction branch migration protein RuvA [Nitrospiraceae bacterium]|nr:Holliday junction branch migration protein RuvA [Nitrospiraceae bacterium]MSR24236.1 Holliday junction branch migration protein RuvA [Nitrospiraceae bacterium]
MIAALTGRLAHKAPSHVTLDVHGVGYEVFIPLSTFYALPEINESASLSVHTHLREDAIQLYGFVTVLEKDSFILLTSISGIGPKLALSVLSALNVPDLVSAILAGDVEKLASVPGIGKKTAARIALELKDKVERLRVTPGPIPQAASGPLGRLQDDALSALVNLGYKAADVKEAITRAVQVRPEPIPLTELIREVLKDLARR